MTKLSISPITVKQSENPSEYKKQWRLLQKSLHRCTWCGKQDAYTLNNRTLCFECAEKANHRKRDISKNNEYTKQRHQRLINEHRCTKCGIALPINYKKHNCSRCLAKAKAKSNARNRNKGILPRQTIQSSNLYVRCCKQIRFNNSMLCFECYTKSVASINYARSFVDTSKHPWRKDNNNVFKSN